jgi:ApbE superfamily uncharacterized protein (UPF0280 family)
MAMGKELVSSIVRIEETDLHVLADRDVSIQGKELVVRFRLQLERYIQKHPDFRTALMPLPNDPLAPPLIREMLQAGRDAGVGPMAAVAGVVAGNVGKALIAGGVQEVIVENGGDIYLHRNVDSTIAIFAGQSPLSYNVGIRFSKERMPCGVCTSSGSVGHSLSFGDADSVTVVADSIALADAAATRLGNEVGKNKDRKVAINTALLYAKKIPGIRGVVVICDDVMGAAGDIELVRLQ